MTDINARIDWQPGMELTAQSLRELAARLDFKQQVTGSIAHNHRIGILPQSEFRCQGAFVKNVLEINGFRCMALLPSGRIIDADEDVTVKIPLLYGDKYYLTVTFGSEEVHFGKGEVPLLRPHYLYEIRTIEEIAEADCLPVMKFVVREGVFNIDASYVPPYFLLTGDSRFGGFIDTLTAKLDALTAHANLEDGEGKRCLLQYLFRLRSYDRSETTQHFVQFAGELAGAVDYYVMRPHMEHAPEIPVCSQYDVAEWLTWLTDYLTGALSVLDKVVLVDNTIDYEKLKQEVADDVYRRAYDKLYAQVKRDILDKFNPEMEKQLRETLTAYLHDTLGVQLRDDLQAELTTSLHEKLYQPLYDALYTALYIPVVEEEVEEFVPQI